MQARQTPEVHCQPEPQEEAEHWQAPPLQVGVVPPQTAQREPQCWASESEHARQVPDWQTEPLPQSGVVTHSTQAPPEQWVPAPQGAQDGPQAESTVQFWHLPERQTAPAPQEVSVQVHLPATHAGIAPPQVLQLAPQCAGSVSEQPTQRWSSQTPAGHSLLELHWMHWPCWQLDPDGQAAQVGPQADGVSQATQAPDWHCLPDGQPVVPSQATQPVAVELQICPMFKQLVQFWPQALDVSQSSQTPPLQRAPGPQEVAVHEQEPLRQNGWSDGQAPHGPASTQTVVSGGSTNASSEASGSDSTSSGGAASGGSVVSDSDVSDGGWPRSSPGPGVAVSCGA